MKLFHLAIVAAALLAGCSRHKAQSTETSSPSPAADRASKAGSLAEARKGFQTKLVRRDSAKEPVPEPPSNVFQTVHYDSPVGKLAGYLTPDPKDGKQHPAIIWITGGDCNTIGDVWSNAPESNDQTAAALAGLQRHHRRLGRHRRRTLSRHDSKSRRPGGLYAHRRGHGGQCRHPIPDGHHPGHRLGRADLRQRQAGAFQGIDRGPLQRHRLRHSLERGEAATIDRTGLRQRRWRTI